MASISFASCSGSGRSVVPGLQPQKRAGQGCNLYQSVRRSTQSVRTIQCDDGGIGLPGWDETFSDPGFTFDLVEGDMFYGAQDYNYGDPCGPGFGGYAVIGCTHSRSTNPFYSPIAWVSPPLPPIQIVTPGSNASRGDNCTGTNGLAIGFPLPGASQHSIDGNPLGANNNSATISNQAQITVSNPPGAGPGIYVIGFLVGTKGDGYFFVPNVVVGVNAGPIAISQASAGMYPLPSPNVNSPNDIKAIQQAYNDFVSKYGGTIASWLTQALGQQVPSLGITGCFTSALHKYD